MPLRKADAIVVLGNNPPVDPDGNVRPETRRRVEAGVEVYQQGMAPVMLMSGGPAGALIESEVMRKLAIELGVPEAAIWIEPRSTSTIENARYSVKLLRNRLRKKDVSVIVVSSPYHTERARMLFECYGIDVQTFGSKVPDSTSYAFFFTIREWFHRVRFLLSDKCSL